MKWFIIALILVFVLIVIPGFSDTNQSQAGYLSIISSPSGATVTFDGINSGVTPVIIPIPNSSRLPHSITLEMTGYQDWTTTVNKNPDTGSVETISATLTDSTDTGTIQVISDPTGATATCDGSNTQLTPYTYRGLSPGKHEISLSLNGYYPYSTTISVASGAESVISAALSPEETRSTGSISVSSDPTGATVTLDEMQSKITPNTFTNVKTGTHTIEIKKSGYSSYTSTVTVTSGVESEISASLSRVKNTGSLTVNSDPSGASIYLNNVYYGISPIHIDTLDTGIYTIKAEKSSYNSDTEIINLIKGQENTVQLTLSSKMPERPFNRWMDIAPMGIPLGGDIPMGSPGMPPGPR